MCTAFKNIIDHCWKQSKPQLTLWPCWSARPCDRYTSCPARCTCDILFVGTSRRTSSPSPWDEANSTAPVVLLCVLIIIFLMKLDFNAQIIKTVNTYVSLPWYIVLIQQSIFFGLRFLRKTLLLKEFKNHKTAYASCTKLKCKRSCMYFFSQNYKLTVGLGILWFGPWMSWEAFLVFQTWTSL